MVGQCQIHFQRINLMKPNIKKFLSGVLLLIFTWQQFLLQDPAFAQVILNDMPASEMPQLRSFAFDLSPDLGKVESVKTGSGPALIHIQEAHGSPETQNKIFLILEDLYRRYQIDLVLLEGSAFKLHPDLLRFYPDDMDQTIKSLQFLAGKSIVTGPDLFLVKQQGTEAYGIEDAAAYRRNSRQFVRVIKQREESENFLLDLDKQINRLTAPYLNQNLRSFLDKMAAFETQTLLPGEWLSILKNTALGKLALDLEHPASQIEWPMLTRVFVLKRFEERIDAAALEKEKSAFLRIVRHFLARKNPETYGAIKQLLELPVSRQQLPDPGTRTVVEKMAALLPSGFQYARYPNLNMFLGHLILQSELKNDVLLNEIDKLSGRITDKLAGGEKEREIVSLMKDYRLLKKLFALELTPDEYEKIETRETSGNASLLPAVLIRRFLAVNTEKRVRDVHFDHAGKMDALFDAALDFYRGAKARDRGMFENIEKILKETGKTKAAVITGGFHAAPFRQFFENRDYNYALVLPAVSEMGERDRYLQFMLEDTLSNASAKATLRPVDIATAATDMVEGLGANPLNSGARIAWGLDRFGRTAGSDGALVKGDLRTLPDSYFGQFPGREEVSRIGNRWWGLLYNGGPAVWLDPAGGQILSPAMDSDTLSAFLTRSESRVPSVTLSEGGVLQFFDGRQMKDEILTGDSFLSKPETLKPFTDQLTAALGKIGQPDFSAATSPDHPDTFYITDPADQTYPFSSNVDMAFFTDRLNDLLTAAPKLQKRAEVRSLADEAAPQQGTAVFENVRYDNNRNDIPRRMQFLAPASFKSIHLLQNGYAPNRYISYEINSENTSHGTVVIYLDANNRVVVAEHFSRDPRATAVSLALNKLKGKPLTEENLQTLRSEARTPPDKKMSAVINIEGVDVEVREGGNYSIDFTRAPVPDKAVAMEDFIETLKQDPALNLAGRPLGLYFGNQNQSAEDRDAKVARVSGVRVLAVDQNQEGVVAGIERIGAGIDATLAKLEEILALPDDRLPPFIGFDIDDTLLGLKIADGREIKEVLAEDRPALLAVLTKLMARRVKLAFLSDNDSKATLQRVGNPVAEAFRALNTGLQEIFFYTSGMVTKFKLQVAAAETTLVNDPTYGSHHRLANATVTAIHSIIGRVIEAADGSIAATGLLGRYYTQRFAKKTPRGYKARQGILNIYPNYTVNETPHGNLATIPTVNPRDPWDDGSAAQVSVFPIVSRYARDSRLTARQKDERRRLVENIIAVFRRSEIRASTAERMRLNVTVRLPDINLQIWEGGLTTVDIALFPMPTKADAMKDFLNDYKLHNKKGVYIGSQTTSLESRDGAVSTLAPEFPNLTMLAVDERQEHVIEGIKKLPPGVDGTRVGLQQILNLPDNKLPAYIAFSGDDVVISVKTATKNGKWVLEKESLMQDRRQTAEHIVALIRRGVRLVFFGDNSSQYLEQHIADPLIALLKEKKVSSPHPIVFYSSGTLHKFRVLKKGRSWTKETFPEYGKKSRLPKDVVEKLLRIIGDVKEDAAGEIQAAGVLGEYYTERLTERVGDKHRVPRSLINTYPRMSTELTPHGNAKFPTVDQRDKNDADGSVAEISIKPLVSSMILPAVSASESEKLLRRDTAIDSEARLRRRQEDERSRFLWRLAHKIQQEWNQLAPAPLAVKPAPVADAYSEQSLIGQKLDDDGTLLTPQMLASVKELMGVHDLIGDQRLPQDQRPAAFARALGALKTIHRRLVAKNLTLEAIQQEPGTFRALFGVRPVVVAGGAASRFSSFVHKTMVRAGLEKTDPQRPVIAHGPHRRITA